MSNGKKAVTIFDVAEISGVSVTTISRVLNAPEKVNQDTRKKVLQVIDELGFVPKADQRARAKRLAGRIGVVTNYFYAPSFIQRLRGIAGALSKAKLEMVIYTADSDEKLEGYISSLPILGNLDGLVILTHEISDEDALRLLKHKIPTVMIERQHPLLNSIEIDDEAGGRLATEFLISKGHRKIAFLGDNDPGERPIPAVNIRLQGFRQSMKSANLEVPAGYVQFASFNEDKAQETIRDLVTQANPPSAVFAGSDNAALQVIKACRKLGIKVPEQLAIIGFDDIDTARFEELTTVRQHLDESGQMAVEVLLAHINNASRPVQHVHLSLDIVERATT
jgi:LacI family transcriptional regulator